MLEICVSYFWIYKLVVSLCIAGIAYLACIKYRLKSKFLNVLLLLVAFTALVIPVRVSIDTKTYTDASNNEISATKVLPAKIHSSDSVHKRFIEGTKQN